MSFTLKNGFTFGGWLPAIIPNQKLDDYEITQQSAEKCEDKFLFKAFLESMRHASIANPNPSVGCVIVKNNNVISSGCTDVWGGPHAERMAFDRLPVTDLLGADVYVTLEPCTHFGRQPPCVELFKDKGIQKIVVGCLDPNPIMKQRGLDIFKSWGLETTYNPIFVNEIIAWNYPFFIRLQQKRIFIALKWAQSLDGCLADDNNGWQWISNTKSRYYAHWLRQKYDAILVGIGTVLNDFPTLNVRHPKLQQPRNPLKIICDPEGLIFHVQENKQSKLVEKTLGNSHITVFLVNKSVLKLAEKSTPIWIKQLLNDKKIYFIPLNDNNKMTLSASIVKAIDSQIVSGFLGRPIQSVLVEGGARLLSAFIDDELFDVAHVFIAPFFLGGSKNRIFSTAKRSFSRCLLRQVSTASRYHLVSQERLDSDTLIEIIKNQ